MDDNFSSFIWDHKTDRHMDGYNPETDMRFEVVENFRDPLTRQIREAVRIKQSVNHNSYTDTKGKSFPIHNLNRKSEFFAPQERRVAATAGGGN